MNIDSRIRQHKRQLRKNIHINSHLQNSYNFYGEDSFIFHIIEWTDLERIREKEQLYIDNLKPEYNVSKNTKAPMDGRKHTNRTIIKMSGKTPWNKGIPRTELEKSLMSARQRESLKNNPERLKKLSQSIKKYYETHEGTFKGKHHTEENKKVFRDYRKSKKKIILINTGEIFEAQIDIARKYNIKQGHISECLNNKRLSVKGFRFKYEE